MSATAKQERYDAYVGQIARGAGISSFGMGIGQVLRYVTQVVLARMYGPTQLGFYVLGVTLVQGALVLSQLGIDNSVVRYVADYRAKGDVSRVRGTILLSLWLTLALSLVLACLIFFGADFLAEKIFAKPSLGSVFRIFSVAVPFITVMSMTLWATQGFQTVKYQTYVQHILQPLLMLGLTVVFYLLGAQIFGAVAAYVLSMVVGSILALYYLKRIFPNLSNRNVPPQFESRALFSVAVPMSVVGLARWGNQWGVITVVGILATAEDVGIYNAAAGTGGLSVLVLAAFSGIFSPIVASLYSRGLLDDLSLLYQDVSRWIFAGSLTIFLLTVLLAKDIMSIFGDDFISGWPAMALLSAAQLFNCSVGPTNRIMAMTGHQRIYMVAILTSTVVGLTASVALVPLYGVLGAAIAMAGGIVLFNAVAVLFVRRLLGVWPYNRHWPKLLVAGSMAAAAALLARLALPLPYGLPTMLVIGPVFLMSFVVSVLTLGLSVSDREVLKALWTAVRRAVQREA